MSTERHAVLAFVVLGAIIAGCHRTPVVSGQVTYDGRPVKSGSITFLPADGRGPSCGGKITDGRYSVALSAGKKIVQIASSKTADHVVTRAELEKLASQRKPVAAPAFDPDAIPDNAVGNNTTIETPAGGQTLDFHLQRPAER